MNKCHEELCAEIDQEQEIQYDEEIREEMFNYIFFENMRE